MVVTCLHWCFGRVQIGAHAFSWASSWINEAYVLPELVDFLLVDRVKGLGQTEISFLPRAVIYLLPSRSSRSPLLSFTSCRGSTHDGFTACCRLALYALSFIVTTVRLHLNMSRVLGLGRQEVSPLLATSSPRSSIAFPPNTFAAPIPSSPKASLTA